MSEAKISKTLQESTPWWPPELRAPEGSPNILVVLFDDTGFSDFGCYGSPIRTPTIDRLAAEGLRFTGFHTTAMCSTTRSMPRELRQRLSGLSRQDCQRGGNNS
jgi:hypothetical protein